MSKRFAGVLALVLVIGSLAAASAGASEFSKLNRVARESRTPAVIGPEPGHLPVASPATPGDDDMPERGSRGPKGPGESGTTAETPPANRWMGWLSALRARWLETVRR